MSLQTFLSFQNILASTYHFTEFFWVFKISVFSFFIPPPTSQPICLYSNICFTILILMHFWYVNKPFQHSSFVLIIHFCIQFIFIQCALICELQIFLFYHTYFLSNHLQLHLKQSMFHVT